MASTSSWLEYAPESVHRVVQGLSLSDEMPETVERQRAMYQEHFRTWTMYRFIDAQVSSTDSIYSYTTSDVYSELPPSPASGPAPRVFAENEPLGDIPRDIHLPGPLREPTSYEPLEVTLRNHVASFYPNLADFLARRPSAGAHPHDDFLWVCPDCGYFFTPLHLGVDEHAYLIGIVPHLDAVNENEGSAINASNHTLFLNYTDHFIYYHVDYAHLREIGMFLVYPNPDSRYPAPATWRFVHDQPVNARPALTGGFGTDVQEELDQIKRDLDRQEAAAHARLRADLAGKGKRAVQRALHRVSVRLTRWRRERRTERRDFVQGLLAAGRSIVEVGQAVIYRLRTEEQDVELVGWLDEFYSLRRAYPDFIDGRIRGRTEARIVA